jgi:hypothetical protein
MEQVRHGRKKFPRRESLAKLKATLSYEVKCLVTSGDKQPGRLGIEGKIWKICYLVEEETLIFLYYVGAIKLPFCIGVWCVCRFRFNDLEMWARFGFSSCRQMQDKG